MTPNSEEQFFDFFSKIIPLTDTQIEECSKIITTKFYKKGDYLQKAGDVSKEGYFIVKGAVHSFYLVNNEEKSSRFQFENGMIFELKERDSEKESIEYIQAIEDCEVIILSYKGADMLFNNSHPWEKVGRLFFRELLMFERERVRELLLDDAKTRYKSLLKKNPIIFERVPQYMIASYLGIKPQSLSRIRKNEKILHEKDVHKI
jgi:CRP/FNR family transcriptional regulator, anaerobic regulatory protein